MIPRPSASPEAPSAGLLRWWPAFILAGGLAMATGVRLAVQFGFPMPFCLLRASTGVPCPGCGCTRSLLALTHLDLGTALRFNPLFFAFCLVLPLYAVLRLGGPGTPGGWRARMLDWGRAPALWRAVLVLAGLNWVYLIATLPR